MVNNDGTATISATAFDLRSALVAALARAEAAEAEAARLRAALEVAAVRFGICAGRMRACHSETGNHELLDEVEMFASETRAILAGDRGAVLGDDSRESSIAHKWARAAFTLAHFENDTEDTAQLKQAVRDFWAPMDYSKDEDEIMRVAILLAIQEVRQHGGWRGRGRVMAREDWPRDELSPKDVAREYPALWRKLNTRYAGWSPVAMASIASLILDTCGSCHSANRSCQCWNDE